MKLKLKGSISSIKFHSLLCQKPYYLHLIMDIGGVQNNPQTIEEIFKDFKGRRVALIKALTAEKLNLCLYGLPNEQWEVSPPVDDVSPELPEPALGINFARDGMQVKDWLALVAVYSDSWLISVAFFFGSRFGFDEGDRRRLFDMINELQTVYEVVAAASAKKQVKERSSVNHSDYESGNEYSEEEEEEEEGLEDEQEEEEHDTLCGACGEFDASDEFWICCDKCETWFHSKCVKITPTKDEHIKQCKCPSCCNKQAPNNEESKYQDLPWQQRIISCWKLFTKCLLG